MLSILYSLTRVLILSTHGSGSSVGFSIGTVFDIHIDESFLVLPAPRDTGVCDSCPDSPASLTCPQWRFRDDDAVRTKVLCYQ